MAARQTGQALARLARPDSAMRIARKDSASSVGSASSLIHQATQKMSDDGNSVGSRDSFDSKFQRNSGSVTPNTMQTNNRLRSLRAVPTSDSGEFALETLRQKLMELSTGDDGDAAAKAERIKGQYAYLADHNYAQTTPRSMNELGTSSPERRMLAAMGAIPPDRVLPHKSTKKEDKKKLSSSFDLNKDPDVRVSRRFGFRRSRRRSSNKSTTSQASAAGSEGTTTTASSAAIKKKRSLRRIFSLKR